MAPTADTTTPPPPPLEWHYLDAGERVGPVGREALRRAVREGRLRADTLVWTPGMADWRPAGGLGGLESLFSPPPPPTAATGPGGPAAPSEPEGEGAA